MIKYRPEQLALRAVNQYRRRDILSYLGLRYYLNNSAARSDNWIKNVSVDISLTRTPPYYEVDNFKEISDNGIIHRKIFIPTPNDALSETALLNECSNYPKVFGNNECVFSYVLSDNFDNKGVFSHYIYGLRKRQLAIASACDEFPNGIVQHIDIKKFYPSIKGSLALKIWQSKCEEAGLNSKYRKLGETFIQSYRLASNGDHILVGPMFSHFLANLVMQNFDSYFSSVLPAKYFRYVDDMTLVGDAKDVTTSIDLVKNHLEKFGLLLHEENSPKNISGSTKEWLKYKHDFFDKNQTTTWKELIGSIKIFLYKNQHSDLLEKKLREIGVRLPIFDYRVSIKDRTFLKRISSWAGLYKQWFQSLIITQSKIINDVQILRENYFQEVKHIAIDLDTATGFERKSKIPKIRYLLGRLIYLLPENRLVELLEIAQSVPELTYHSNILVAIITGEINSVLDMGADVSQATAQIFKAIDKVARYDENNCTSVRSQYKEIAIN